MKSFTTYISEKTAEAPARKQNTHLDHVDEYLYLHGDKGATEAVKFIREFIHTIGTGTSAISIKWDGAPALFAGTDPTDGKFFVGTKSVFAKTPKLYKSAADVHASETGAKADKLIVALEELPKLRIPKNIVLQGDFLWGPGDLKVEKIDGVKYVIAHPNTIAYAWPYASEAATRVRRARMGIIFHTTYTGKGDLSTYTASFGASVAKLRPSSTCWFDDAFFKGTDIAFTAAEYASIDSHVDSAEKLIGGFDRIISILDGLPSAYAGAHVKVFVNSNIRVGKYPNPKTAFDEYVEFIKKFWEKQIEGVKTEDAKSRKRAELQTLLGQIVSNKAAFVKSFEYINHINHAKLLIIRKINELSKDKMYIKTATGYKVSNPEGFVAIDIKSGAGVKFVDRLEFSYNNFSSEILKGWQK